MMGIISISTNEYKELIKKQSEYDFIVNSLFDSMLACDDYVLIEGDKVITLLKLIDAERYQNESSKKINMRKKMSERLKEELE